MEHISHMNRDAVWNPVIAVHMWRTAAYVCLLLHKRTKQDEHVNQHCQNTQTLNLYELKYTVWLVSGYQSCKSIFRILF